MAIGAWLSGHWFELLQTASIVVGLFVTAHTIRQDTKERKIQNLFAVTSGHREVWSKVFDKPELARILKTDVDLEADPVSFEERLLVQLLILHLNTSFKARKEGMEFDDDGISADIHQFFERPIPRLVWERAKHFQSNDFIAFVEEAMR